MNTIPNDPAIPALQEFFPPIGVPSFVAEMAQEVAGTPVNSETAKLCHVRYRPTRNCVMLWSFPTQSGRPLLVSGLAHDGVGISTALPSFHASAEIVRIALGAKCPYKYLPNRQLLLQVFPLDIRLPGLAMAGSETWVREPLCQSFGLPHDGVRVLDTRPVSYKPWRRCVLQYVVEVQGRPVRFFGKVFRDDRGETMVARLEALRAQLLAAAAPWEIAMPVMWVPEARMLVLAAVEESDQLSALLRKALHGPEAREKLREQITTVAEGLSTFQRMVVKGLRCRGPRDVLREGEKELAGLVQVAPALAKSIQVRLRSLERAASRLPAEEMVLSHGAFRYNQFLRRGDNLIALDLDALCLASASADPGEFLSYLDLTALRRPRLRPVILECEEVFLAAVVKDERVDPRWLAWYRVAAHLKWAQRSFFSLDSRWPEITEGLLEVAEQALQGLPI